MSDIVSQHSVVGSVWSRSNNDDLVRERSHWRGSGRYSDDRVWRSIGQRTLREVRALRRLIGLPPLEPRSLNCLEWGPGGGTNVVALAPYAINYAGVDVSAPNLEECERQATEAGFSGFQPILLIKPPEIELRVLRYEVDLFISTATFQHFPSQEYAVEVLNSVMRVMANGGLGVIQIRFDNGNPKYADKNPTTASAYAKDYLTATSFRLDAFWDLLLSAGFVPEACRSIKTSNNYATFLIRKPSAA